MREFKLGDRVVLHKMFAGPVGGTVIDIIHEPNPAGTFPHMWTHLYVIFDDGTEVTARNHNFFLERDYDPRIPF